MKYLVAILSLVFALTGTVVGQAEDGSKLMPRTRLPDQPPTFYNITVWEEYDPARNVIVKKQEWQQYTRQSFVNQWRQWQYQWVTSNHSKELSTRAMPAPTPAPTPVKVAEPLKASAQPIDDDAQKPASKEHTEDEAGSQLAGRLAIVPKRPIEKEFIPEKFSEKGPERIVRPKNLISSLPAAMESVAWFGKKSKPVPAENILPQLENLRESVLAWQSDMHGRFGLCPVDKAEAEANGTLEKIYVPYQVASGRIYLVRAEVDLLIHQIQTGTSTELWSSALLQLLRRLDALESQLRLLTDEKEKPYSESILGSIRELAAWTDSWNPATDESDRRWVLRWQNIAEDLQIAHERREDVRAHLPNKFHEHFNRRMSDLDDISKKLGKSPWKKSLADQERVARRIYVATNELSRYYETLSDTADSGMKPSEYLKILGYMGATEDLRVFSLTILQSVTEQE